jgi:hypothetical protein
MATDRVRGQETSILVTRGGNLESTMTDIQNFNLELEFEVKSVGYLGQKTNKKDFIFNGVKFDFELHTHTQDWIPFAIAVQDKAKRNNTTVIFTITTVLQYPDGTTPDAILTDVSFGALPINVSARGDYVKHKIQGECEDVQLVTS